MNTIKGKLRALRKNVIVCDMDFDMERSVGGIFIPSDDGKSSGIHPRWARVFSVGPDEPDIKVNDWILIAHARWSRGIKYETENGELLDIRLVDNNDILLVSDEKPSDVVRTNIGPINLNVSES
jgi:hypothetical protein